MQPEDVRRHLTRAGIEDGLNSLRLEPRDGRWLVRLPGDRLAWFPMGSEGAQRLARERRVLRLIEARCRFAVPRVLLEGPGGWDVRTLIPSSGEPFELFRRLGADPALARRVGRRLGEMLADQHANVPATVLSGGWLPQRVAWPDPLDVPHLALVAEDPLLLARLGEALARYGALPELDAPVLVHGDLGLHNIAVGADGEVRGLFDYDGAAFGDRHEDFKYLILHPGGEAVFEAAVEAYEPLTGVRIDRDRVRVLHAAAAIGFLAFRHGHPPNEAWCGRTLAEDLAWTKAALAAIGA